MSIGRQYSSYKLQREEPDQADVHTVIRSSLPSSKVAEKKWGVVVFQPFWEQREKTFPFPTTIDQQLAKSQTDCSRALALDPDQRFCCVFTINDSMTFITWPDFIFKL